MGCRQGTLTIEPVPTVPPEEAVSEERSPVESGLKGNINRKESGTTKEASSTGLSRTDSGVSRHQVTAPTAEPTKIAAELKPLPSVEETQRSEFPGLLESGENLAIAPQKKKSPGNCTTSVSSASFESVYSDGDESVSSDEKRLRCISTDKLVRELSKRMMGAEEEAARKATDPIAQVQRLRTFYGFRERVSTSTDLTHHPNDLWWSEAHNDSAKITNDLGRSPKLLSNVIKVRVVRRPNEEIDSDMSYFSDYVSMGMANPDKRYIVFKLGLGDHIVVTLSEVFDDDTYESLFEEFTPAQMLMERMKFITCPANLGVPVPLLGPKAAQTLGAYFGMSNVSCQYCSTPLPGGDALRFVSVYIDIYSKWILRRTIPSLAFTVGRISDFYLVDYEKALIYSSFRLVCTQEAIALLKK
ncbi:hypothetical protein Pmar_PMAR023571 [Perkinsus marinus ATCC 50983]|uniref:Uncharacterized protein n=1 Tax=Perkinsus marinus (strain ATCC 50983 / TXsc) TaxID=423536 RepID=C5KCQ1_PERM5|nr:hypothetical protein Pmar_PMAR023571 [Perkinsus marinus ATCC 50983]EER17650.1 hypothetical protein Pmar_PMAR023571 [Perkinsus marinus ATCC 50983]|eukprot:XP_002785854.1 hypothetical protein Pmar_PMAR023571 [Perkinsus marinus ATCC 50983]